MDATVDFLSWREAADIPFKPKTHLMLHLASQCHRYGNPLHVATWFDEGLNRQLAQVASTAHGAVWHRRVLATFRSDAGPDTRPVKRRKDSGARCAPHRF